MSQGRGNKTIRFVVELILVSLLTLVPCGDVLAVEKPHVARRFSQTAHQTTNAPIDPGKHAVIISGASGDEAYAKQFDEWSRSLRRALTERLGFDTKQVRVLSEKPVEGASRATAEEVRKTLEGLRSDVKQGDSVLIFFIGHGTFDGNQAKFNLVGPDLPAHAYRGLLDALPARRVVLMNMASASGEFIKPLAAKGRVIVTATRSGEERNATRFAEHFIAALQNPEADADQNKRISVLEAFQYGAKLTAEAYKSAGRLATEHALLEDNGDGVGHPNAEPGGDGALARVTYFDSPLITPRVNGVETAKLITERTRLEEEVEQLKNRKAGMQADEYDAELEKILIDLAKLSRVIRGAAKPASN